MLLAMREGGRHVVEIQRLQGGWTLGDSQQENAWQR